MSSTSPYDPPIAAAAAAAQPAEYLDQEQMHALLKEKDDEIASLKQAILYQHKEIKRLKKLVPTATDITTASIQGIASQTTSEKIHNPTNKVDERWKNRFQQLVAYKLEHGNADVPQSYKDKSLHAWVRSQREAKKEFDKGKATRMTQERIDALESIGFRWVVGHQPKDAQWEEQFQALMAYKQQHGHTRVSASENKSLYKWVLNQRARRRLLETHGEGKAKGMTWARVEKLSAIEFVWEASSSRRRTNEGVAHQIW